MTAVWLYLALVNIAAFAAFAFDKHAAQSRARRIPENTLLGLALIGGSAGAFAAQRVMRHKTAKQPFRALLIAIGVFHVALTALILLPGLRAWLIAAVA
ncbi:MAG: DUF1294 domain-containing protein [Alphaproteobacteria bacterium]|nr:DUF1294 domain-containing protein [Alphaproteobacteria bacterium]